MAYRKYYIDFNAIIISITLLSADICGGATDETRENVDAVCELYTLLNMLRIENIISVNTRL